MWADIHTIFMIDFKILHQIELGTPGSNGEWNFCARIHITLLQIMYDCKCSFPSSNNSLKISFDSTFISKFFFIILNFKSSRKWLEKTLEPRQLSGMGFWICRFFIFQVEKASFYFPFIFLMQNVSWSERLDKTCRHCSFPSASERPWFFSVFILWLDLNSAKCRATHLVKWNVEMPSDISLEKCSAVVLFNCQVLGLFQNSFFKSW